ncbi:uncharacterized protein LOC127794657 [Diospyros lotus]|uniref:uncharacterized protein LOC127794657 n=1 Tax=Diospyros lotus TaxID=55363 RepID=UPI00224CA129|nr:uncharacterized protein LOC127794657 [Diospyros lotus]
MVIVWNEEWNDNKYIGGNRICAGIYKNTTFTQLVEIMYTVTGIDKTRYNITIHFVTEHSSELPVTKFPIKDDYGVKFIMCDDRKYKVMYVDMICKDVGVCNLRSGGNQDSGAVPFTPARSPLQNDDFGTYGMGDLSDDAPDTDDDYDNETDDNSGDNDGDNSDGGGDERGVSSEYPEVRFSGSQFEDNHLQRNWIVPGMDYQVRRSCTIRFEASCKDVNCKFMLRARCRPGCSFWHVVKFMPNHTCISDVYDSHFRNVKAIVIESLFSERVASSEYTPRMLMGELLEQHDVQIMYSKVWRSLQHAKRLTYGNADESYQQLPSYFHMLKETNPDSIAAIETDENNYFLYSFFALEACLHGFRSYIRPVVTVDATHLKGENKWVIFVATCKDGEEMIYPIAFGFGDSASDRSWIWFLTKLREAIGVFMRVYYHMLCHSYYIAYWVRRAYAPPINLLPNKAAWVLPVYVRQMVILPPVQRRQPGRPRNCRIPSMGKLVKKKCEKCVELGHNSLGCPNERTSFIGESSTATTPESRDAARASARASRKCSICKETGHIRRQCPI